MAHWNNNPSSYRPPPGPPPGRVHMVHQGSLTQTPCKSDGQFGQPGYSPSYGPPPGPPPGYGLPAGPPPGPPPIPSRDTYPGSTHPSRYLGQDPIITPMGPPPGSPHAGHGGSYGPPRPFSPDNFSLIVKLISPSLAGPPPRPPQGQQRYGPQSQQQQQPYFQYSQCTGKKKALCIGINYFGQQAELRGCINDARNIERFLCERFSYKREDIVVLTDDQQDPRSRPTKKYIMGAQPNDSLFFHYSGHGGQTKDLDGDEQDGYDEVIYPVDFKEEGHIVDDDMHDIMVRPLPPGCRLTAIYDANLPYVYSTEGKVKEPNLAAEAGQGLLTAVSSYARGDMGGVFKTVTGLVKTATTGRGAAEKARRTKTSPADAISWSGCKDSQTSADAVEAGSATGAMSYAFIAALNQQPQQSYQQLLQSLRDILRSKYSQKPQDTSLQFIA
ncbi:caspase domain-containing protein [Multifurca ochricompacta]|uniref:Caspase domain-containing protein n=1 Tax=Multifurca ochricompacta TaxID=376703 RepID=A0AAD4M943_9AGAM|nr:caspase domain-containing protein [Multifurca ochricompacta]